MPILFCFTLNKQIGIIFFFSLCNYLFLGVNLRELCFKLRIHRTISSLLYMKCSAILLKIVWFFSVLQYTSVKPLGDRVLIKIKTSEEVTAGGILLPSTAQSKPQSGEVVAVGEGRAVGNNKLAVGIQVLVLIQFIADLNFSTLMRLFYLVQPGSQVIYSKYAGTELELNGASHIILKEDDIVGILEAEDVKDLKPLNDRILIKVAEAEEKTAGGLLLTEASKEKPSIGTVVAVGSGALDEEGNRKPLTVESGSTVLYSKYAGNEFKGADGSGYVVLKASDVLAILS
ncbi:20 kDa chaperonin, chloroplastic-like isoform X1 [Zingiber officinale]|uniref:20 kDa chaperonin, chloroplastic-like isoform X1 n=1 Tax=Zingiber officinale TaxID=94328 RepID=UPI001C4D9792|nr:20 kDa chaperonin, chloroplastic-like isoform X1 [Zingiber officinale]